MVEFQKAISLIRTQGSQVDQIRLACALGEAYDKSIVERLIDDLQLPEGGFPFLRKQGNPYSLNVTCAVMANMTELGLNDTPACRKLVDFLARIQCPEGCFDENPELEAFSPPFWDRPGDLKTQLWLTGALADNLTRLRYGESSTVARAADFLLSHRNEDGSFQGFRHTTWLATAVLGPRLRIGDKIIRDAIKVIGGFHDLDGTDLTWVLDCLFHAGIPRDHQVVANLLERLEALQRPNGSWLSTDHPEDLVCQTLGTLIVLRLYRRF
ncbi:MAG: prenyltransferase/squalene oxidase repeat-containing protein [Promethearchaeota archaeon]